MNKQLKLGFFIILLIGVITITAFPLVLDYLGQSKQKEGTIVKMSMSGFNPNVIEGKAGEPLKISLVNMDNENHSDGGGWHQLKSDELKIDYKIPPKSTAIITITVDKPGEYKFYCGVCCGGKENPNMWGVIKIT